jgi:hypothetical protein
MPSPGSTRLILERVARVGGLGSLLVLLWTGSTVPGTALQIGPDGARGAALTRATRESVEGVSVAFRRPPDRSERDWLRALRGAGTPVTWQAADSQHAMAIVAEVEPGPDRQRRVAAIGTPRGAFVFGDRYGAIDSTTSASGVAVWRGPVGEQAWVRTDSIRATYTAAGAADDRAVLVIARAGWEGKFVAAALEERGWRVETDFRVAPRAEGATAGIAVRTAGAMQPIDTARYTAVVVLDESGSARAGQIAAFVRSGGGVLIAAPALGISGLSAVRPASAGALRAAGVGRLATDRPRRGLELQSLQLRTDAIPIERDNGSIAVAARREQLGRVIAVGYRDSWRWRLLGGDDAPDAHRRWWSDLVGAVAAQRPASPARAVTDDPAPLAALIRDLGPPASAAVTGAITIPLASIVFAVCVLLLLGEWTSRRLRGAR